METALETRVASCLSEIGLRGNAATILVAISGGQDSCALLHSLANLRTEFGFNLVAAHLNHGARGEESDHDEAFVSAFCQQWQVALTVQRADVPAAADRLHTSFHEAARAARTSFLIDVSHSKHANWIATGHTAADNAETILHRIIRGTGITGLRGLQASSGNTIRPLLHCSRKQTAEYCYNHNIPFCSDSSNASFKYSRNRIRRELIPNIESHYNQRFQDSLIRLSQFASHDDDFLNGVASEWLQWNNPQSERVEFSMETFAAQHIAIKSRVLRQAICLLVGNSADVEQRHLIPFLDWPKTSPTAINLPNAVRLRIRKGLLIIDKPQKNRSHVPQMWEVVVGEEIIIPNWNLRVTTELRSDTYDSTSGELSLRLPVQNICPPLVIRNRRPGDTIDTLGITGTQKLQDVFINAKVPACDRDSTPIVADREGILWIAGHVYGRRTVGDCSEPYLRITIIPDGFSPKSVN